jgi:outer membrane protein insertion porin family
LSGRFAPMACFMTDKLSFKPCRASLTLVACLLATSALAAPAFAQELPQQIPVQAATAVQSIVIRGNERIEESTVLAYLPITVGQQVTDVELGQAVSSLFESGLFADVNITLQGQSLVVQVVENPIINRVIFEGDRALKEDKLRDEVTAKPRGVFTRAKVQQDVQRIIELYRRAGRINATVTPKIVELPQKRVDLVFEIDEGPKSGVLDVNFVGNKEFSDNALRDVVVTKRSVWYKPFSANDNYDPDRVDYDEQQLRDYYRNRGYYNFRVVSSVAELRPERNGFVITYTLDEGREYRFGKLSVETKLQKLDSAILQRLLPISSGDLYREDAMTAATDALTFAAGSAGFAFVDIRPRFVAHEDTGLVDVIFEVVEGPRVYVDRIDIVGNTQTLDKVIRREMEVSEGDAFNQVLVDRSKNRIRGLGFFKDVTVDEIPGSAPDRTNLRVQVEEQPTGELAFSAGYSSIDKMVIDMSIVQRNFRGRGQNLRARVSTGSLRRNIDFSFTEPRFLGRNLAAGVDLYSYRYDFSDYSGYITEQTGFSLRTAFPLSLNSSLGLRYSLRSDNIDVSGIDCTGVNSVLCSQSGSRLTSLIGYTWALDRRNDPIRPTRGFNVVVSQDLAGLGGDIKYVRSELDSNWYYGFTKDFIFSARGQAGYIDSYGGGEGVRINDRFFKGGATFRGFETAGIGPRDISFNNSVGGKLYAIGSLELTVPTFLPEQYGIKAALFTDFGTLGRVDATDRISCSTGTTVACFPNTSLRDNLSLRASSGISIGWKSPLGPIQFDISRPWAKEPYDQTESFRFSTSTKFQ